MAPVVIAKDLYKCYAGFAPVLRGVNIEVEPGEMVAIMGPSGCGKSTMLHILGLLHAPDAGTLEILGTNALTLSREQTADFRRRNIGFVMQSSNLFEHSTVFENVEFPLIYENVPPQERWERVIRALDLVRLSARVHYRSNRLSGGEQQRVAIARAMVNNPRILMADEPTGALDARTSRLIMENFRALCHSGGVSMIMVTHDPKMAEYCDSVYTLEEGVLVTRKHEAPSISHSQSNFLKPPEPLARGALVAWRFPRKGDYRSLEIASRLHSLRLLSRIYAISSGSFLANPEGYSLPLAVRRVGFWQNLFSFAVFFRKTGKSDSLWSLWRKLPSNRFMGIGARIKAFAAGARLARWAVQDNIQYFYAVAAGREATAAWVAARLAGIPFAFSLTGENLARFGRDFTVKIRDSAFVACSTSAEIDELRRLMPEVDSDKIPLVREGLAVTPQEEEGESAMPGQRVLPLDILAPDAARYPRFFQILLEACSILKKRKVNFRLTLTGPKTWRARRKIFFRGLRKLTDFSGVPALDMLGEIFRKADVLVAWQPPANIYGLPESLAEGMAYAAGIIACDPGKGMLEALKDKENCLVISPLNANSLAEAIVKLNSDLELRKRLGETARRDIADILDVEGGDKILADRIIEATAISERAKIVEKSPDMLEPPRI